MADSSAVSEFWRDVRENLAEGEGVSHEDGWTLAPTASLTAMRGQIDTAQAVIDDLRAWRERARRMLQGFEWGGWDDEQADHFCFQCGNFQARGHTNVCELAALLTVSLSEGAK